MIANKNTDKRNLEKSLRAKRIREKMEDVDLKSVDIANITGASSSAVSQWLSGRTKPSGEKLVDLANALGCDPKWIMHGDKQGESARPEVKVKSCDDFELIPKSKATDAWLKLIQQDLSDSSVADALLGRITTKALEPKISAGSRVLIDTRETAKQLEDGGIYALKHGDQLAIRKVAKIFGSSNVRLSAVNNTYPDTILSTVELAGVIVMGKVLWYSKVI